MSDHTLPLIAPGKKERSIASHEIRTELIRKSIHMLIALVPILAQGLGHLLTAGLLLSGILAYTAAEFLRLKGHKVFIISRLTNLSARHRDSGHFVLAPVTLGFGAVLALMLYPEPAASIAIYALAFGDGFSSLIGKIFGTIKLPMTGGKTLEGSFACFTAVLVSAFIVTQNMTLSVVTAVFATALEAIPTKDFDNVLLPAGTGAFVYWLISVL